MEAKSLNPHKVRLEEGYVSVICSCISSSLLDFKLRICLLVMLMRAFSDILMHIVDRSVSQKGISIFSFLTYLFALTVSCMLA